MYGCYYDSKEYLYPQDIAGCDTTNVTYSLSVSPVLNSYCLSCHSNSSAASIGGNIRLETYSDVIIRVDDGSLIGSIDHDSGFSPMPKGSSKLDFCKITVIQKWIDEGSPNN
jgi:hypothetical protein